MYVFISRQLHFKSKKIRLEKNITDIQNKIQTQHKKTHNLLGLRGHLT